MDESKQLTEKEDSQMTNAIAQKRKRLAALVPVAATLATLVVLFAAAPLVARAADALPLTVTVKQTSIYFPHQAISAKATIAGYEFGTNEKGDTVLTFDGENMLLQPIPNDRLIQIKVAVVTADGTQYTCRNYERTKTSWRCVFDTPIADPAAILVLDGNNALAEIAVAGAPVADPARIHPITGEAAPAITAVPTKQSLTVNDVPVDVVAAFNINNENYFKLRDIAALVNTFDVRYDAANSAIKIVPGAPYVPNGAESTVKPTAFASILSSNDAVYMNDSKITLTAYKIDGSNYFRLRDLGDKLGFEVGYDEASKTVRITVSADVADVADDEAAGDAAYFDEFPTLLDFGAFTELYALVEPERMDNGAYMYVYMYTLDGYGNEYTFAEFEERLLEPYLEAISADGVEFVAKTDEGFYLFEGAGVSVVVMFDQIMEGTVMLDVKALK
jgi:hypothetical protein